MAQYKRILLKISGEALAGKERFGVDPERVRELAIEVSEIWKLDFRLGW